MVLTLELRLVMIGLISTLSVIMTIVSLLISPLNFQVSSARPVGQPSGLQVNHEVTVYDPVEVFGAGGAMEGDGHLATPHFFVKAGCCRW